MSVILENRSAKDYQMHSENNLGSHIAKRGGIWERGINENNVRESKIFYDAIKSVHALV